jgi:hypothetical protein
VPIEELWRQRIVWTKEKKYTTTTSNRWTGARIYVTNRRFQRLLKRLWDYFIEDADEEIASDMADRWVAFSRTGKPNYEESKAEWRPWRFNFDSEPDRDTSPWRPEELDFLDIDSEQGMQDEEYSTAEEGYVWSEDPQERAYRRRALEALEMEVIEEDVFQTMLRRTPKANVDTSMDNPFNEFLFGRSQARQG